MATSTLTVSSAFTRTNATQPDQATPVGIPAASTTAPTQVIQTEVLLPAAGTSVLLSSLIPSYWTTVSQVHIVNIDATGYVSLKLGASSPDVALAPDGGTFACTPYGTTVSGGVNANTRTAVGAWTLQTMSSAGVTASGAASNVYIYIAGI